MLDKTFLVTLLLIALLFAALGYIESECSKGGVIVFNEKIIEIPDGFILDTEEKAGNFKWVDSHSASLNIGYLVNNDVSGLIAYVEKNGNKISGYGCDKYFMWEVDDPAKQYLAYDDVVYVYLVGDDPSVFIELIDRLCRDI